MSFLLAAETLLLALWSSWRTGDAGRHLSWQISVVEEKETTNSSEQKLAVEIRGQDD